MISDRPMFAVAFFKTCQQGFDRLSHEAQICMRHAIESSQVSTGLFAGRHGAGDLYYTFFGLLLTLVTNAKINVRSCQRTLSQIDPMTLDLVHGCVWLRAQRLLKLLSLPGFMRSSVLEHLNVKASKFEQRVLESFHRLEPASFPQSDPQSPYSQFLLMTIFADLGMDWSEINIRQYCLEHGLYSNIKHVVDHAVNATASAMFLLSDHERQITGQALCALQQQDGSFKAVANAPCGDLLSTGTASFALNTFGITLKHDIKSFLRTCVRENGLFAATPDDPISDLEYTVYALLSLGGSR